MNVAVRYFSRSGNTRALAEAMAEAVAGKISGHDPDHHGTDQKDGRAPLVSVILHATRV